MGYRQCLSLKLAAMRYDRTCGAVVLYAGYWIAERTFSPLGDLG